jgi:hypothetical protein
MADRKEQIHEEDKSERIDIQSENDLSRKSIHESDHDQVKALADALDKHVADNKAQFEITSNIGKTNAANIAKILPLADSVEDIERIANLSPIIENMVKKQEAATLMASWAIKIVTAVSLVVGIVYAMVQIIKDIRFK